jgi:hypothetical protein
MSRYFFIPRVPATNEDTRQNDEEKVLGSAKPYGSCRRHENVENPKTGFPHFHSALENSPPKNTAASFPQLPQGLLLGPVSVLGFESQTPSLRGEYPIEGWHGDYQCLSVSEEIGSD